MISNSPQKKVLMISTDRSILEDGSVARRRMIDYANAFGELHIIVTSRKSQVAGQMADLSDLRTNNFKLKISDRCFVYPTHSRSKIFYIFDAVRIGSKTLSDFRLATSESIITTQDPFETGLVGLILAKKYNIPLDVQIHTDFLSPFFSRLSWLNRVRVTIASCVLRYAKSIRVVSERIRLSITQNSKFKIHNSQITVLPIYTDILPAPISPSRLFPRFDTVVLMTARLEPEKDVTTALRAFARAEKSVKNAGLIIAGSGSEEPKLFSKARELGISDRVMFVGWKNPTDLAMLRASADVFLSTSLYEGYGIAIVEAARSGLAIVSTDAGIAPNLLSKGLLANPGDVDTTATILADAMHHPEKYRVTRDRIDAITYTSFSDYIERLSKQLLL